MDSAASLVLEIAEIKATIRNLSQRLEKRLELLEGAINLGELDNYIDEGGSYLCEGCRIKRVEQTRFTYSDAVKTLKEQEEHEGIATKKVSSFLRVTLPKNE